LLLGESKRLVRLEASRVHGAQHGNVHVRVVVDSHADLCAVAAHEPPGVLDESSLEGEGEGEEKRVELGAVETFPEVLAGGDDDEVPVGGCVLDLREGGGTGAFARPPSSTSGEMPRLPMASASS